MPPRAILGSGDPAISRNFHSFPTERDPVSVNRPDAFRFHLRFIILLIQKPNVWMDAFFFTMYVINRFKQQRCELTIQINEIINSSFSKLILSQLLLILDFLTEM